MPTTLNRNRIKDTVAKAIHVAQEAELLWWR